MPENPIKEEEEEPRVPAIPAMNETDESNNENGTTFVDVPPFIAENEKKNLINSNQESLNEDQTCEQEEEEVLEVTTSAAVDGRIPSPAEIKLKIKKSLLEFRCKVEDAIRGNYFLGEPNENISFSKEKLRDISLWGIPLLPSKAHEGTDIVFRKFLKAKDFKVNEAFEMLQKTMIWRIENKIDGIVDEDLGSDMGNVGFLCSRDREGRPVSYYVCGVFRDKKIYKKTFGSEQKCDRFLRWRIQLMEMAVQKLCFREGGVHSIVQIFDWKNVPSQGMKEFTSVSKKVLLLYQNYYPEIIQKNIVVYAPFWFYTSQVLFSRFMSQRNKKKFILVRPQKVTKTLLKFISPEHLPVEYGGLRRKNEQDFSLDDKVLEQKIRGSTVSTVEFPVNEPGVTITWDVTVVGWDVSYKEEFIPDDEGSYTILLQNQNRTGDSTRNSFYISEPGKIVITIENGTFKKKKMFYRTKSRTTVPMFILLS